MFLKLSKIVVLAFLVAAFIFFKTDPSLAQSLPESLLESLPQAATDGASASPSAEQQKQIEKIKEEDLTKPEEEAAKQEFIRRFSKRPIEDVSIFNIAGFTVQYAVRSGVPANTI